MNGLDTLLRLAVDLTKVQFRPSGAETATGFERVSRINP